MKILVLTDHYPPLHVGSYELNCQLVTEGLQARGHTPVVVTSRFGLQGGAVEGYAHRILHWVDLISTGGIDRRAMQYRLLLAGLKNYRITRRFARQFNPDLVFVWHLLSTSILPILAVQDLNLPTVFRIGSHWLIHLKKEYAEEPRRLKRWYRSGLLGFRQFEELKLNAAIMVSESLRQSYQQAGFNIGNAAVIPSSIPGEWIAPHPPKQPLPTDPLRLLYVGRLEPQKGPEVVIKAMEILLARPECQNVYLDMAGEGRPEYVQKLQHLITAANLQHAVRFIGFVPRLELMRRYATYQALLFPTLRWEGLPMSIIEAMSQGLTVIASDIGGPKDIIKSGQNGFLVTPNQPQAFAGAVEQIIKNPALGTSIGRAAIETVHRQHTFETMLDQYETFLKTVILAGIHPAQPFQVQQIPQAAQLGQKGG